MCSELKQGREAIECLEQRGWQLYEGGQHLQVQHLIDIGTRLIACCQEVLDQLDSWGVWELPRDEAIVSFLSMSELSHTQYSRKSYVLGNLVEVEHHRTQFLSSGK